MIQSQPYPYSVRTQFELRKAGLTSARFSVARAFLLDGHWGLFDDSGAIWPVSIGCDRALVHLQLYELQLSFTRSDGLEATKYQDGGFVCKVTSILASVANFAPWPATSAGTILAGSGCEAPGPLVNHDLILSVREECQRVKEPHCNFVPTTVSVKKKHLRALADASRRIRDFFENRGFLNCDVPYLVPSGGMETYLSPFETVYEDHRGKQHPLQLPTSPEFALKKLIAAGHSKIFHLGKSYRNKGEVSKWHEPEFLLLEWYRVGEALEKIMEDTRLLVESMAKCLGSALDLPQRWTCFRVADLFQEMLSLDLLTLQNKDEFLEQALRHSGSLRATDTWNDIFCKLFMEKIEPRLSMEKACFVTDYPVQMGALATQIPGQPFVQRFEAFLNGVEVCNGYFELTDSAELQRRFEATHKLKDSQAVPCAQPLLRRDAHFEEVMQYGLPPCAGNALGVERVTALLLGEQNIQVLKSIPFLTQFPGGKVAFE